MSDSDPTTELTAAQPAKPQPSRFYRWAVLAIISLAMFGNYYVYDCIAPIADLLAKQLHFSDSNIGLLQAIYSIPNVFMVLVGGILVDRLGLRKSMLIFGALCTLGAAVTVMSPQLQVMAAGRLIFGLGAESLIVAVTTAIAKWFRGKELSFAFGINLMIARFGSWLAQNSPTWAKGSYESWRSPLLIAVKSPEAETTASEVSDDSHRDAAVTSRVEPSDRRAFAVSWKTPTEGDVPESTTALTDTVGFGVGAVEL